MKQNLNLRWHMLLSALFLLLYCGSMKAQSTITCTLVPMQSVTICAGGCAFVTNTSTQQPGDTTCFPVWGWSMPGGIPSSYNYFQPPCITYNTTGTFVVTLYGINNDGDTVDQESTTVTVVGPPNAAFTYSPVDPCYGSFVSFVVSDSTLNPNNYITWDFGDGNLGSGPTPSNLYGAPGTYTVTCCVGNACDTLCTTQVITVHDASPFFTWSGTCNIDFVSDTLCDDLIAPGSHFWDFGDVTSGPNNTATSANPSHTFTLNNHTYVVTHTIQTPNGVQTYTATVIQTGPPVANISGYQVNNCGNGTISYTANPCMTGISYNWTVVNGTPTTMTGCSIDINWNPNGGYVILAAWDSINDCTGYDTLIIPGCCTEVNTPYRISNTTASAVLSSAPFAPCITAANTIHGACSNSLIVISGVFTIDVPLTFLNCNLINFSPNARIVVNPGQTLTLDHCTTAVKCDTMWDGIYLTNVTSTLNIINTSVIQQAKNAVVSNSGGRYFIENSFLRNNYKDIVVNAYSGTHPGIVRNTNFTMVGNFLPAIPALPAGHTKTVCAIEIKDNADITIGDASTIANRNRFDNIFVGVLSLNSKTKVVNARFVNIIPTFFNVLNSGTAIVATGMKNVSYQAAITVGGTGLNRCVFTNVRIGVDAYDYLHTDIRNNNFIATRTYAVRIQNAFQRNHNIIDNNINNSSVNYAFNTAILVLECYDAVANINGNFILQTSTLNGQVGTGIRVSLVTPGNVMLNIVNNVSISRVRTGILLERLVGKNFVYVTNNAISFTKPNPNYTQPHHGVHLVDCGGNVRVEYNTIQKSGGIPTSTAMRNNLRGVTIQNSPTSIVAHNTMTRMGTGVFGIGDCANSTLACNNLVRCYDGFFFTGPNGTCNIGDQVINPTNGNPAPTGNIWTNSFNSDLNGGIFPGIYWYTDALSTPTTVTLIGGSLNGPNNTTTSSGNPSACSIVPLLMPLPVIEREQNAGQPVLYPNASAPGTQQGYVARKKAH
jgi:hypothetical protein